MRFGLVSESVLDGPAWAAQARRLEDVGIDSLLIRDHFSAGAFGQQLAPFSALAAAAAATTRLTVGTLVLSNDFRHPAVVAHEAATLHYLSGGRFELGIGAGWYEPEYRAAGIAFAAAPERIGRLEESLTIIKACWLVRRCTRPAGGTRSMAWTWMCCPSVAACPAYWSAPAAHGCFGWLLARPTSWGCCRPRSRARKITMTRPNGCRQRSTRSCTSFDRRPVSDSPSWSSARSQPSASPLTDARLPKISSPVGAGARSNAKPCGRCRPSSSAVSRRFARTCRPGKNASACRTSLLPDRDLTTIAEIVGRL